MASKVKSAVMLLGLAGLMVLCHMAGMKLESRMKTDGSLPYGGDEAGKPDEGRDERNF